jgi:hypothetical protein
MVSPSSKEQFIQGVHRDLRDYEPMAWDFCLNFAKDNNLQVAEACLIPDEPAR